MSTTRRKLDPLPTMRYIAEDTLIVVTACKRHPDSTAYTRRGRGWVCGKVMAKGKVCGRKLIFTREPLPQADTVVSQDNKMSPVEVVQEMLTHLYSEEGTNEPAEVARRVELGMRVLGLRKDELDPINRRSHYNQSRFEVIEIIDDHELDFYRGNVVKYLLRAPHVADAALEQLLKAQYYLNRLVRLTQNGEGPLAVEPQPRNFHADD